MSGLRIEPKAEPLSQTLLEPGIICLSRSQPKGRVGSVSPNALAQQNLAS